MTQPQFTVHHNIFLDPTGGRINLRLLLGWSQLMNQTDLSPAEQDRLFRVLNFVGIKLGAVYDHWRRFLQIEADLVTKVHEAPPPEAPIVKEIEVSQALFLELDEFLVQLKSCLDYLVKAPTAVFTKNNWNLHRFGEKGEQVTKALKSLPKKHQGPAEALASLLVSHKPWMETAIGIRDAINHYLDGAVPIERFAVCRSQVDDKKTVHRPMWNETQALGDAMEVLWSNLFLFVEDFIALTLSARRHPGFAFAKKPLPLESTEVAWFADLDEAAKASLLKAIAAK